jgi:hypothetical protein
MLYKGAPFKTCVLCGSSIEEAKLNREFIVDLLQLIPSLTHEAVAVDLLRGAVCRETITRIFSPAKYPISQWFSSSATINVVASIVLRPKIRISSGRGGRAWWLTDGQRDKILGLLHEYGVGCASGECCGLVRRAEAASVKRLVAV